MKELIRIRKKKLKELSTHAFKSKIRGKIFEGFVVQKDGAYFAYQNLCKHLPVTLDLNDNRFFNHDKKQLQCHMHGALYEIETGNCIAGPCQGAKLNALELEEDEHDLIITLPTEEE